MALSASDGVTRLWGPRLSLEQVHLAAVSDGALVLAGLARELPGDDGPDADRSPGTLVPRIVVLDPMTGLPAFGNDGIVRPSGRSALALGAAGVKWLTIAAAPLSTLVYGTAVGIDAVDLHSGQRVWFNASYGTLDTQGAWNLGGVGHGRRLVFQDQRARLRSIDLVSGVCSEQFQQPPGPDWDANEFKSLLVLGHGTAVASAQEPAGSPAPPIWAHYRQRIVQYDPGSGEVTGCDAVTDPQRDYRWAVPVSWQRGAGEAEPGIIAVSVASRQADVPGRGGRRTQYEYTVYRFSANGKTLGEPYVTPLLSERVQQVTAIDGTLLLSTLTSTLAVPMTP
jgi:hypothetical protein